MSTLFNSPPRTRLAGRALGALLALLATLASWPLTADAISPEDLLPVDDAFQLQARAAGPDAIELRWDIADGYYLYRHRTSVQAGAGFQAGELQLPPGIAYEDEFFGAVETYRGELVATLPGTVEGPVTTLTVKYQGCADLGICYPPQTRTVEVALPATGSDSGGTGPAASLLAGGLGANPLLRGLDVGGADALPEQQAFTVEAISDGGNGLLVRMAPAPGYYLYRDQTSFELQGEGVRAGPVDWPAGIDHHDEYFGDTVVYMQPVDVPVPVLREHPDPVEATLVVSFQGCQDEGICYPPMTRSLPVSLPAGAISEVERTLPPQGLRGALDEGGPGIVAVLLLAVIGGLILNLMPCVLPVLSLKALSLASGGASRTDARRQALWYTAGVLVSFVALGALALALRKAGLALGWGFQLQQPLVVGLLGLVMFALGLSLSGVWHFGGRWTGVGHGLASRSGPAGDFFTGVLAVVVATPCTAPFMGAALAWAFAAPAGLAMLVFVALGLGLALPFLLIGLVPALADRLPRPGAWMETLKQLLAFPLYLTAVWLVWVLARQRGADAVALWLLAAVLLAFAAWAWTRSRTGSRRLWLPVVVLGFLAMAWPLYSLHTLERPAAPAASTVAGETWREPFSQARLTELRQAGRPVFVNITADWCVSCKANEAAVLARDGFREALEAADMPYLVGDWTDVDPALTRYLQEHKAVGVPLYVVYPAGGGEGEVLPILLTPDIVHDAIARAAAGPA